MKFENVSHIILGGLTGFLVTFYGSDTTVLKLVSFLMVFIGFDLATGWLKTIKNKDLKSSKFTEGIIKKVGVLMCVSFGYFIDASGVINIGLNVESAIATAFIFGEAVSIAENFKEMGVPVPPILLKLMEGKANGK